MNTKTENTSGKYVDIDDSLYTKHTSKSVPVGRITQLSDKPFLQKPPDGEPMVRITVKEYDELVKARAERDQLENLHVELIADIKRILEDTP